MGGKNKQNEAASGTQLSKEDRKREQNRISQRCLREKRLLQLRQVASVEKAIQFSTSSDGDQNLKIQQLTAQLLEVTDQNKKLSDALLKMRKKFLSLGVSATMAAEDGIFNDILGLGEVSPDQDAAESRTALPQTQLASLVEEVPVDKSNDDMETNGNESSRTNPCIELEPGTVQADTGTRLVITDDISMSAQEIDSINGATIRLSQDTPVAESMDSWFLDSCSRQLFDSMQNGYESLREQALNFGHDTYPPADYGFSPFNEQRFIQTSVIEFRQCCSFTQTVEDTCHHFKSQFSTLKRIGDQISESGLGNSLKSTMSEKSTKEMTEKLLEDLIKIATYLILSVAKVEKYAYGLGLDKIVHCVLRWRLFPSRENVLAIPQPFRPSPLQAHRPKHHIAVDCCVWPEIRDQMILHQQEFDMDEFSSHMIQNTVLEIPYLRAAVNILDLYFNDIVPEENLNAGQNHYSGFVSNAGGVSGMISTDDSLHPLDPSLLHEFYRRIAPGVPSDIQLDQLPPRSRLSSQFGLNNFNNWKLSKEFGQKYHFLDCSSAESKYPTVSAATVLSVGLWVLSA